MGRARALGNLLAGGTAPRRPGQPRAALRQPRTEVRRGHVRGRPGDRGRARPRTAIGSSSAEKSPVRVKRANGRWLRFLDVGKRVVETYFDAGTDRWKNRVVGGPNLPNEYLLRADAERDGRSFADFLSCEYRLVGDDAPDPAPAVPAGSPELRGRRRARPRPGPRRPAGAARDRRARPTSRTPCAPSWPPRWPGSSPPPPRSTPSPLTSSPHTCTGPRPTTWTRWASSSAPSSSARRPPIDDDLASGRRRSHPAG